ncbi:ABZJ_00895 family protein [Rhodobacteraceae bacterium NNCM2]|nr:ABZJ_00895 family protein [Coraliihabitans acroporae]
MSLMNQTRLNFALAFLLWGAAVTAISIALALYTTIDLPNSAAFLVLIAAVAYAGKRLGRQLAELPPSGLLWRISFDFVLISTVLPTALYVLPLFAASETGEPVPLLNLIQTSPGTFFGISIGVMLFDLVITRIALRGAIKLGMKEAGQRA